MWGGAGDGVHGEEEEEVWGEGGEEVPDSAAEGVQHSDREKL